MPAQNQEPDLSFDIPAKELLGLMEQSRKRALEFGSAGSHQAAYESNREYRMYAGMLETSGMADQIRHASRVLTRMNPMQAQRLAARLPEQYEMQSRTLGINWDRYDQSITPEYWMSRGMSDDEAKEHALYKSGQSKDPELNRRGALRDRAFMKHVNAAGQIDAESVERGLHEFRINETDSQFFRSRIMGLPEDATRALADTMATIRNDTGAAPEALTALQTGMFESFMASQFGAGAHDDEGKRRVGANQVGRVMTQFSVVAKNPMMAPMVATVVRGDGGLELNYASDLAQNPQGIVAGFAEIHPKAEQGLNQVDALIRDGVVTDGEREKLRAAIIYRHAPPTMFKRNYDLENKARDLLGQVKTHQAGTISSRQSVQAYESGDQKVGDFLSGEAVLTSAATPEGRARVVETWKRLEVPPESIERGEALLETAAHARELAYGSGKPRQDLVQAVGMSQVFTKGAAGSRLEILDTELGQLEDMLRKVKLDQPGLAADIDTSLETLRDMRIDVDQRAEAQRLSADTQGDAALKAARAYVEKELKLSPKTSRYDTAVEDVMTMPFSSGRTRWGKEATARRVMVPELARAFSSGSVFLQTGKSIEDVKIPGPGKQGVRLGDVYKRAQLDQLAQKYKARGWAESVRDMAHEVVDDLQARGR